MVNHSLFLKRSVIAGVVLFNKSIQRLGSMLQLLELYIHPPNSSGLLSSRTHVEDHRYSHIHSPNMSFKTKVFHPYALQSDAALHDWLFNCLITFL